MKQTLIFSSLSMAVLFAACSSGPKTENNGKIKLAFQPENGKAVKINYEFTVNSVASNAITTFNMVLSGKGMTDEKGIVTLELKNDSIRMDGSINGQKASGAAGGTDTIAGDLHMVATPVFAMLGKSYRSIYNAQLDKKAEMQIADGSIVDSTENKMQILLRYPTAEVAVGDSWNKEIFVKAGNKMNCAAKYTLRSVQGDTATITIEGKLTGSGESFGNEFTIDGNLTGTFVVSVKTGWPFSSDIQQDFTLKMGGKDLPMKYSMKSKAE